MQQMDIYLHPAMPKSPSLPFMKSGARGELAQHLPLRFQVLWTLEGLSHRNIFDFTRYPSSLSQRQF